LLALPKPTLAMMQGHAIAGGLVLVLACDYRLGLDGDYRVGLNEVAVGAAFPRTALEIVRLRLAHARASELILGAALYPATQAVRLGIVDELLPADRFEETVLRRAAHLARSRARPTRTRRRRSSVRPSTELTPRRPPRRRPRSPYGAHPRAARPAHASERSSASSAERAYQRSTRKTAVGSRPRTTSGRVLRNRARMPCAAARTAS